MIPLTPRDTDPPMPKAELEEGTAFAPKFDEHGLIPCICTDHATGEPLMFAFMNDVALQKTIETGKAHYYSRSRGKLWLKGKSSGQVQHVRDMRTDCDQDVIWIAVEVIPDSGDAASVAAYHTGYRTCFYRRVPVGSNTGSDGLEFALTKKVFDPKDVYGK